LRSLNKKTIALLTMVLMVAVSAAITYGQSKMNQPTSVMKLYELPKDINRAAVPVTGKVRGLQPPGPGEHQHPH
jgi:hypothetical protein